MREVALPREDGRRPAMVLVGMRDVEWFREVYSRARCDSRSVLREGGRRGNRAYEKMMEGKGCRSVKKSFEKLPKRARSLHHESCVTSARALIGPYAACANKFSVGDQAVERCDLHNENLCSNRDISSTLQASTCPFNQLGLI